ncbi:MAG: addiction module protein [Alphaproteobacteria bacterium HGW-Alphaproteobacteria-12]|nr:MAG: addiction module protein [Alphaproteobacteria bacterium HGW-Alphaproteobacteria-12]
MPFKVEEYLKPDGASPFGKWFNGLSREAAYKVVTARARMENGNLAAVKWVGAIGEYRIDWGPGLRIYLARDGKDLVILFGGGTKKRQQADIREAEALLAEYRRRKAQARKATPKAKGKK